MHVLLPVLMAKKNRRKPTTPWGKVWYFIWHDDSLASWLVNIILAFILIKFVIYPGLGAILGTDLPVVAVVSESMDHGYVKDGCNQRYVLCGDVITHKADKQSYWDTCGEWYEERGLTQEAFDTFKLSNGFSKGDIIVLKGKKPENIQVGDIIVFRSTKPYPIIHRVTAKQQTANGLVFQTKGDHNEKQITETGLNEQHVPEDIIIGTAAARIPMLGWVKIALVDLLNGTNRC